MALIFYNVFIIFQSKETGNAKKEKNNGNYKNHLENTDVAFNNRFLL